MDIPYRKTDRGRAPLAIGDEVRIMGIPDLSGMAPTAKAVSLPVFEYLVGKYKKITNFDEYGCAEISFRLPVRLIDSISSNRVHAFGGSPEKARKIANTIGNSHTVWLEPFLLKKRSRRVAKHRKFE
jgi:hypothetical protein